MRETPAEAPPNAPAATRLFGPRGRHRRPRPRKVLLAAGGLALAAGALSLVRMSPDSGVSGLGAAESDPAPAPGTDAEPDRSSNAANLTPDAPKASPSATSAMGGLGTAPTTDSIVVPTPARTTTTTPPHLPGGVPAPTQPAAQPGKSTTESPTTTPGAPRPTSPAPETTARPPTSPTPTQQPQPDDNSVCIPIIGLCVDPLPSAD
ncbi:hypothetical protein [Streptomyces sp. bgisy027]|uniref:hypothetical protein n=1 Tax=Streptomyces sp. bgisy027 TaxID=3413770 RepID=UPI003D7597EA